MIKDAFTTQVKSWLANDRTRTRAWLANICHVEKRTVDNWFSSQRAIPKRFRTILLRLILSESEKTNELIKKHFAQKVIHHITLPLTDEQLMIIQNAAHDEKTDISTYLRQKLLKQCLENLSKLKKPTSSI